jgi:hypothetical protein
MYGEVPMKTRNFGWYRQDGLQRKNGITKKAG